MRHNLLAPIQMGATDQILYLARLLQPAAVAVAEEIPTAGLAIMAVLVAVVVLAAVLYLEGLATRLQ